MRNAFKRHLFAGVVPAALLMGGGLAQAQVEPIDGENFAPKPRELSEQTTSEDGTKTTVITPEGPFEPSDPAENPTNLLPTVFENAVDSGGDPIPNTLPSTPEDPYNLHPDPEVTPIDKTSPTDDIDRILRRLEVIAGVGRGAEDVTPQMSAQRQPNGNNVQPLLEDAVDIIEGEDLSGRLNSRVYEGFPLLHYNGPDKTKAVEPITNDAGEVVGGNVDVHQLWYDTHIESDTFAIDPSAVQDVPWTITYTVDVLNRGHEDWAPMAMFFDDPEDRGGNRVPHVTMDMSFFPMEDGLRYVFELQMPPGRFWNLSYHWGWRIHPPRVQVLENALKAPGGKSIPQWEIDVFGENPTGSEEAKLDAIAKIGDLAPAKRMWKAFRAMQDVNTNSDEFAGLVSEARRAFLQWQDRSGLPDGVQQDPDADVTLFYVNNTIYGKMTDQNNQQDLDSGDFGDAQAVWFDWSVRPATLNVTLLNGDFFPHAYQNVDFGGRLGWENTYHNTIPIGGQGPWFTFGRFHWMPRVPMPPMVPAAQPRGGDGQVDTTPTEFVPNLDPNEATFPPAMTEGVMDGLGSFTYEGLGRHEVEIQYNYEPSRRLKFYQFDPLHHDVAIWSVH